MLTSRPGSVRPGQRRLEGRWQRLVQDPQVNVDLTAEELGATDALDAGGAAVPCHHLLDIGGTESPSMDAWSAAAVSLVPNVPAAAPHLY
jgi:hypothetical protein